MLQHIGMYELQQIADMEGLLAKYIVLVANEMDFTDDEELLEYENLCNALNVLRRIFHTNLERFEDRKKSDPDSD
jgi:hypothetical protein